MGQYSILPRTNRSEILDTKNILERIKSNEKWESISGQDQMTWNMEQTIGKDKVKWNMGQNIGQDI